MKRIVLVFFVALAALYACKTKKSAIYFLSPEQGSSVNQGSALKIKLETGNATFDSVSYLIDSRLLVSKVDTTSFTLPTDTLKPGLKVITARVYNGEKVDDITTNIVVLSAKAPVQYGFDIVNTFPHDTASFTEGLEFHDGVIYESDGLRGESSIRKADLRTGKPLLSVPLDDKYFGEGLTVIGDKVIQITYQEKTGFVYDRTSLKKLGEFPYVAGVEGWGMCNDGKVIYNSDGTNVIHLLNINEPYQQLGEISVYDNKGAVDQLNELEYIDGKLYANIFQKDLIVIIDPKTGIVEGEIDLTDLYRLTARNIEADVLNGIAWDAKTRRLFVTGKKWDKLFEIKLKQK